MSDELEIPGAEVETVNEKTTVEGIELVDEAKVKAADKAKKEMAEAIEKARQATLGGQRICQRCGHDTKIDLASISDEDKQAFLASVLGDISYEKKFYAMGKIVETHLMSTPSWFMNMVKDQLINDHRAKTITTADEYRIAMYHYCLVGSLKTLKINGVTKYTSDGSILDTSNSTKRSETGDTPLKGKFAETTLNWSDIILSAVVEAQSMFNNEMDILMRHANDPAFWESVKIK